MKKTWTVVQEGQLHTVTLEVDWTSRREIRLDGRRIIEDTPFHNLGSVYKFEDEGHRYVLTIGRSYFVWRTKNDLSVDGVFCSREITR